MSFFADTMDVSAASRHVLTNVGLLQAILLEGEVEVFQLSMVTQVIQEADGSLMRQIFNPLE